MNAKLKAKRLTMIKKAAVKAMKRMATDRRRAYEAALEDMQEDTLEEHDDDYV